jgi:hypothetical protein
MNEPFIIIEMNHNEDDDYDKRGNLLLKPYEILPQNSLMSLKQLCESMSNNTPSEYFKLLNDYDIVEIYELYSISAAKGFCQEQKYKEK